jgi:hypothetical protein
VKASRSTDGLAFMNFNRDEAWTVQANRITYATARRWEAQYCSGGWGGSQEVSAGAGGPGKRTVRLKRQ